ncbi:MAG: chemotaxis-specific protein-glutamate methyltransferase CheB [Candidatus Heimdallarchaeaceae archaeon]
MRSNTKKRVFIADDSAVTRRIISRILSTESDYLRVIGTAPNGKVALEKLKLPKYEADVIIIDIVMPEMDGIELIHNLMLTAPTPVVAISAFRGKKEINTALSRLGVEVFESGAVQFVSKPNSKIKGDDKRFERQLLKTATSLASVNLVKSFTNYKFQSYLKDEEFVKDEILESKASIIRSVNNTNRIIIIGASAGGPKAISLILSQFKPKSPPIIVVQHMPKVMMLPWCQRLQKLFPRLNICIAKDGEKIRPNRIYVAPGGYHCAVDESKSIKLLKGEKINFVVPAIDITFSSAAENYRENVLGILLTGMGNDGFEGAKVIKKHGGVIFAEHESTAVIHSMPKSVIKGKLADRVIPLHKIPAVLRLNNWL